MYPAWETIETFICPTAVSRLGPEYVDSTSQTSLVGRAEHFKIHGDSLDVWIHISQAWK